MTARTAASLATQAGLAGTVAWVALDLLLTYVRETACDRELHRMMARGRWYKWWLDSVTLPGSIQWPCDPSPSPRASR